MPEIKFIMVLGGQEKSDTGYCISSIIFLIFHSTPVTAWLLSSSEKEKKKHSFLSGSTAASGQMRLFFMCKKLTGSRLPRQTGDHPQPWECEHSVRVSLLRGQKQSPTLQVASEPLPRAVCNPNQITSDFRPSSGNLIIFLPHPMGDGRLRRKRREEWKINTST